MNWFRYRRPALALEVSRLTDEEQRGRREG